MKWSSHAILLGSRWENFTMLELISVLLLISMEIFTYFMKSPLVYNEKNCALLWSLFSVTRWRRYQFLAFRLTIHPAATVILIKISVYSPSLHFSINRAFKTFCSVKSTAVVVRLFVCIYIFLTQYRYHINN